MKTDNLWFNEISKEDAEIDILEFSIQGIKEDLLKDYINDDKKELLKLELKKQYNDLERLKEIEHKKELGQTTIRKDELFINYINKGDKEQIIQKLHYLLDNKKGKSVAEVIKALCDKQIIIFSKRSELYRAMRKEFGCIGADSGLNYFLDANNPHRITSKAIDNVIEALNPYL